VTVFGPVALLIHPLAPLALWIIIGLVGGRIMARKGYPPLLGVLIGIVAGPFGLLIGLTMPRTASGQRMSEQEHEIQKELAVSRQTRPCPDCGRESAMSSRFCPRCNYRFES